MALIVFLALKLCGFGYERYAIQVSKKIYVLKRKIKEFLIREN